MAWHARQLTPQTGRTFVVTGANSRLACLVLFAQELLRRCAETGSPVSAVAVHPAMAAARLWELTEQILGRPLPI
jgi:hypothetical protein